MNDHQFRFSQLDPVPTGDGPITLVACDPLGNRMATVMGGTMENAQQALKDAVVRHLVRRAQLKENPFSSLTFGPPEPDAIPLSVRDLFPIVLRYLRRSKNLTQLQLAGRLRIGRSAYSELESPGVNPQLDRVLKIQRALGAPIIKPLYEVDASKSNPRT